MSTSPSPGLEARPVPAIPRPAPAPWRSFVWLCRRECHRVLKVWKQTILAPVVSALLFMVVFGLSLGERIDQVSGFDYRVYIVPGLITMAMAQAAYSNNSSTLFQARTDQYIDDVIAAPMHSWQMTAGFLIGGAFRAIVIGAILVALAAPLTGIPVEHPFLLLAAVTMLVVGFGSLGTVVGIYAESWDNQTFINNIVILPLIFLGGVFYSVERLAAPWQEVSHANPLFYLVDAIRFSFLGASDSAPLLSFGLVLVATSVIAVWSHLLFATGKKLKP